MCIPSASYHIHGTIRVVSHLHPIGIPYLAWDSWRGVTSASHCISYQPILTPIGRSHLVPSRPILSHLVTPIHIPNLNFCIGIRHPEIGYPIRCVPYINQRDPMCTDDGHVTVPFKMGHRCPYPSLTSIWHASSPMCVPYGRGVEARISHLCPILIPYQQNPSQTSTQMGYVCDYMGVSGTQM